MFGENGLIKKLLDSATQKYTQEEIQEKIETVIANIVEKEKALGNDITVENILQELVENDTFESIDKEDGIGNIQQYQIKLKKDETSNIVIEDISEKTGVRITYKLEPRGYTNSDKVAILFKIEGKVKSVTKPDGLVIYPNKEKTAIDYEVDKNGRYPFLIENEDGTSITKNVIVDIIDKLPPLDFEITAKMNGKKLTISHEVKDRTATEESVCSGIERYEYFIKGSGDINYKSYNTNIIENLEVDTYYVYVIAYDKAGNYTSSSVKTIAPANTILYNSKQPDISQWNFELEDQGSYEIYYLDKTLYLGMSRLIDFGKPFTCKVFATTKQLYDLSQYDNLTITISNYGRYEIIYRNYR